jgi:hypothetical protein
VGLKVGLIVALVVVGCIGALAALRDGTHPSDKQTPAPAANEGLRIEIVGDPTSVVYCIGNTRFQGRTAEKPTYRCYDHEGRPTTETIAPP